MKLDTPFIPISTLKQRITQSLNENEEDKYSTIFNDFMALDSVCNIVWCATRIRYHFDQTSSSSSSSSSVVEAETTPPTPTKPKRPPVSNRELHASITASTWPTSPSSPLCETLGYFDSEPTPSVSSTYKRLYLDKLDYIIITFQ